MRKQRLDIILSFLLLHLFSLRAISLDLLRGPYIQLVTHHSAVICFWPVDSLSGWEFQYGLQPDNLSGSVLENSGHAFRMIHLEGLNPDTRYFYTLSNDHKTTCIRSSFKTFKMPGDTTGGRIWVIGDFGNGSSTQIDVRKSYEKIHHYDPATLWLWLGDNAYSNGSFSDYDKWVFDSVHGYRDLMRQLPFYSVAGNHDYNSIQTTGDLLRDEGPYYDLVVNPQNGEAGGVASFTEQYYSFDFANVHIIALNTNKLEIMDDSLERMRNWLRADLRKNQLPWVIAMFHNPPYTKGSHNSDNIGLEKPSFLMREKFLPIFDSVGVDLVLSGHSHNYERSYLIHGHYGRSETFDPGVHLISGLSGKKNLGEEYYKTNVGTVYAVVGNSGASSDDNGIVHPVMLIDYAGVHVGGSMLIDVYNNELTCTYFNHNGDTIDQFTIIKKGSATSSESGRMLKANDLFEYLPFPNPAGDVLFLSYLSRLEGEATLMVYTTDGSPVISTTAELCKGSSTLRVPGWENLPGGLYFITLQTPKFQHSCKVMKVP